jgi:AdoMet-dependent rRNA methyltransferase SPB1
MGKKDKKAKGRLDKFYQLAKEQGYRSRAAFKLLQLNKRNNFLTKARGCIDLCAAPGSWLQVAAKHMPAGSKIIGVDLVPIKPIRNVVTFTEDITTQKCYSVLSKEMDGHAVDLVLADGAPNVGAAWAHDAFTQSALTLHACRLATEFLVPGGTFITKVFRSADYNALLYVFNQLFGRVEATKPQASRNTSAEIFVVCLDFKNPKIDARLLDPKFAFEEVDQPARVTDVFAKKRSKRQRNGYEPGNLTQHKKCPLSEFVASAQPVMMLGEYNQFIIIDADGAEGEHELLTAESIPAEVQLLCEVR